MPRLTNRDYLIIHHGLAWYWQHSQNIFSTLEPNEQWDLHAYFLPYKTLTDEQLLQHRKAITKERPSLPHRAGRAFRHLDRNIEQIRERQAREVQAAKQAPTHAPPSQSRYRTSPRARSPEPVTIRALVNPEINVEMLARACVALARLRLVEEKRERSNG